MSIEFVLFYTVTLASILIGFLLHAKYYRTAPKQIEELLNRVAKLEDGQGAIVARLGFKRPN